MVHPALPVSRGPPPGRGGRRQARRNRRHRARQARGKTCGRAGRQDRAASGHRGQVGARRKREAGQPVPGPQRRQRAAATVAARRAAAGAGNRVDRDAGVHQSFDREKTLRLRSRRQGGRGLPGPVVTRYEIEPATGVKGSQIVGLARDLARSLSLTSIRVVETIPGKNYMALELPNPKRQIVRLSEILGSKVYNDGVSSLTIALGKDIAGKPVVADLAKMPHLLVAGTTGSGKSVGINATILSLLYKSDPADVRMILIDPKMLEMSVYEGIPHLLAPVVTDMRQAGHALNWAVNEMERRYKLMSKLGVRNLA